MLNSFTNALHAVALGIYTVLVYRGWKQNVPHYEIWIVYTFSLVFTAKILGMLVHLPVIDRHPVRHNFFWICISIVVAIMNAVTLKALHAPPAIFYSGSIISALLCAVYVRTLFTSRGNFTWMAAALVIVYLLCAVLSTGILRIAWICTLLSNVLWIVLSRVTFLREYKLHNDIYHFALIGSSYFLYSTIESGMWQGAS